MKLARVALILVSAGAFLFTLTSDVTAQKRNPGVLQDLSPTKPPPCQSDYPNNPERVLADYIIELVSSSTADPDSLLLREAEKLKSSDGLSAIREYLKNQVEFGSEQERAYKFCEILKEFKAALSEDDQQNLKAQLSDVRFSRLDHKAKKCVPFLCVFRVCRC